MRGPAALLLACAVVLSGLAAPVSVGAATAPTPAAGGDASSVAAAPAATAPASGATAGTADGTESTNATTTQEDDAPGGEFDVAEAAGAERFDREVETYTAAGTFVPEEGLDESVSEVDAERVHVLVQFTFDDPRVRRGDEQRDRDLEAEYDLSYCGSYMDGDSGWENAHCFGIPVERVEAFAGEDTVRSVTHVRPALKHYPELETAVREREDGVILLVDTYPDADVSADRLTERYGVEFAREDRSSFSTERVTSMDRVREIAASSRVAWVGWYRPVSASLDRSREHVGVGDLTGPGTGNVGPSGEGVWVGVMDSGIQDDHPHFDDTQIVFSADWVDFGMPPEDQNSHGTHVAGTIAGNSTRNGTPLPGVAPDANLVVARIYKQQTWAIIAGQLLPRGRLDRLDSDAPETMAAVSNSWGMDDTSRATPLSRYDKFARSSDRWAYQHQDTLLVFANGNACDVDPDKRTDEVGCANNVQSPALGKNVLAVGATMPEGGTFDGGLTVAGGEVSPLNDLNPPEDVVDLGNGRVKPEVLAPGESIVAPVPTDDYEEKRGTSMATPHVSGVVAVLAERHPGWDANTKRAVLIATTSPVRNPNGFLEGYGEVNARDALGTNSYEGTQQVFHGSAYEGDRDVQATVTVPEGAHQLDASLAWMDPPKTAGGVKGFIFNRLDLVLVSPSGQKHRRTNPSNVKKISIDDPEPGDWKVVVKGANVGPAFKPFKWLRSQPHRQSYDGAVRVVSDPPRLGVEVEHANLSGPTRAASLAPSDVKLDPGGKTNLTVAPAGLGYVVSDVQATIDTRGMSDVSTCSGEQVRRLDAGDLSEGQSEPVEVCLEATGGAGYGVRHVTVRLSSTNGEDSGVGAGTKVVDVPVFVTEASPPDRVGNLRSTSHTPGEWTSNTTFTFAWDRPSDPGGSGVAGYNHALLAVRSDEARSTDIASPTSGRLWTGDPRATGLVVEKTPTRECYDPVRGPETCQRFSTRMQVNATTVGASARTELWLYVKARDNSSNVGAVEPLGPFLVDLEPPAPFTLTAAKPGPDAGTASGTYHDRTGDYFTYELDDRSVTLVWERPADAYSGVKNYSYHVTDDDGIYRTGTLSDAAAAVAPNDPGNRNRTLELTSLQQGGNGVSLVAYDHAGNAREATLQLCVQGDQPGVDCLSPGDKARQHEAAQDAIRTQEALEGLQGGILGGPILGEGPRVGPDGPDRCPGTYRCGGGPAPWELAVTNERVLVHVQSPDGTVTGRYLLQVERGEVTGVERVGTDGTVRRSVDVYASEDTIAEVTAAEDTGSAVAAAYGRGDLRVSGYGPASRLRFGALKIGAGAYDATAGVVDLFVGGVPPGAGPG